VTAAAANPALPFIVIGGILAIIGIGAYIAFLNEKKRTAALFDVE
jgi:hypothetical protein